MIRRIILPLLVLVVLALFAHAGYMLWLTYEADQDAQMVRDAQSHMLAERTKALTDVLRREVPSLSEHQLRQGFWYTTSDAYGNEDVFYVDAQTLARQGVSDEDARLLASDIRDADIASRSTLRVLDNDELPSHLQFHNKVYTFGQTGNVVALRATLQEAVATGGYTQDDAFRLAYLLELEGKYAERDRIRSESCERFGTLCDTQFDVSIRGVVMSRTDVPVQGARVSVLSRPDIPATQTDANGAFVFELPVSELEKVRIGAQKRNFSEGVASLVIASTVKRQYEVEPIVVESPVTIVTVDTDTGTVTGERNRMTGTGEIELHTSQSTYRIPKNAVVHEDGEVYTGVFDVYLYEFTKETVPDGLMEVDTFDSVMGYAGDLMKTFGMPYIQFFTPDGEELHVLATRPMTLTYQIPHMQELYTNADNIYRALTPADMDALFAASIARPGQYPITREYLIENNLIHFPAFWVFDRKAGVWDNIGIRVNSSDGEIESPFYTINNNS